MTPRPPLVVILGASGFIGSAVLAACASLPLRVRAVSRRPASPPPNARARIEVRTADLTRTNALAEVLEDADVVVHLVARIDGASSWRVESSDRAAERVNTRLMGDVLDLLAGRADADRPPAVIFSGAVTQVGPVQGGVLNGTEPDHPVGTYDEQKLAAERLLMEAHHAGAVRGISLRLPACFGSVEGSSARDKGVVSTMVRRAVTGEQLTLWHDGSVLRDLLFVEDAARAFVSAIRHTERLAGRHWPLGTGKGRPLGEVFELIAESVAHRTGRRRVEVRRVPVPEYADAGDFRDLIVDPSAFTEAVGWRPLTSLEEGIERTVEQALRTREGRSA